MEINNYINQLLYHHECVILPDFGGFIANYKSAKVDYINYNFYPPGKDISFNRSLSKNDGLLINHIANIEKVSFIESKNIVVAFVKSTNQKLNSGKTVNFEGIGKFYYDKFKNLQFEPDVNSNFLLESYGLSSFHFSGIEETNTISISRDKKFDHLKLPVDSRKRIVRRAAIAIPAILLLSVLNFNSNKISNQFSGLSSIIPLPVDQPTEIVEDKKTKEDITTKVISVPVISIEKEVKAEPVLSPEIKKYYIIAGSFSDQKNANVLSKKLTGNNYQSEVFLSENGMFRVAFAGYELKQDALQELRRIRKSVEANAWMLKR